MDSHSTKLERRPWVFVKLSFRDLRASKLSGLHPFDNMAIIHWVKYGLKQKSKLWVHETPILYVIFVTLTENSGTSKISTPPEIILRTHFHTQHGTKTIPVFLPADEEASWLLLPSLVSLLSCDKVLPENTCSCIL